MGIRHWAAKVSLRSLMSYSFHHELTVGAIEPWGMEKEAIVGPSCQANSQNYHGDFDDDERTTTVGLAAFTDPDWYLLRVSPEIDEYEPSKKLNQCPFLQ